MPVIVGGGGKRGVVSTACYIARTFGVRSAMPMAEARRLCPDGVIVPPRMAEYAASGRRIREMMGALTPSVEPLSIDEAFLDLAGCEPVHGAGAAETLARFAARVEAEVGVTVSVGLSLNKFLAKLASDMEKPRGFTVLPRARILQVLAPLDVGRIFGVGAVARSRLAALGIERIGDLQTMSEDRSGAKDRRPRTAAVAVGARRGRPQRAFAPRRQKCLKRGDVRKRHFRFRGVVASPVVAGGTFGVALEKGRPGGGLVEPEAAPQEFSVADAHAFAGLARRAGAAFCARAQAGLALAGRRRRVSLARRGRGRPFSARRAERGDSVRRSRSPRGRPRSRHRFDS